MLISYEAGTMNKSEKFKIPEKTRGTQQVTNILHIINVGSIVLDNTGYQPLDKYIKGIQSGNIKLEENQEKNLVLIKNHAALAKTEEQARQFCKLVGHAPGEGSGWFKKRVKCNEVELDRWFQKYYPLLLAEFGKNLESQKQKAETVQEERNINLISADKLLQKNLPKIEWLVDKIICKQGVTILGGDTGTFKSYTALHIAHATSLGEKFLGDIFSNKLRVLYLDEEMGERTIKTRLHQLHEGRTDSLNDLYIASFNNLKLDNAEQIKILLELVERTKPDLIIVDSMVRFLSGDENSSKDVKTTFDSMKMLMHDHGVSFLILHHTRKSGSDKKHDLRGSGDFSAYADNVFMISLVSKADQEYRITQVKSRHLPEELEYKFRVFDDNGMQLVLENKYGRKDIPSAEDRCAQDILEWIKEENIEKFKTAEALKAMEERGHKNNAIFSALNSLTEISKLEKTVRGEYIRSKQQVPVYLDGS